MSDNDLIRRGDAKAAAVANRDLGFKAAQLMVDAITAITAAQPTVSPDVAGLLDAAEKVINSYWNSTDGVITGIYDLEAVLARVKG